MHSDECNKIKMSKIKYQTLLPIPQSVPSKDRISLIFDIMHGKSQKESRSTRQSFTNTFCKNKTLASTNYEQESTLPCIPQSIRNASIRLNRKQDIQALGRSKDLEMNATLRASVQINKNINDQKHFLSNQRGKTIQLSSKRKIRYERTQAYSIVQQEQECGQPKGKRERMMREYMQNKLRTNKSSFLNPQKDRYRVEIESIVSELTPISQLQEQQQRMARLKKKYNHLCHFDKEYYIKLNQHDAFIIF